MAAKKAKKPTMAQAFKAAQDDSSQRAETSRMMRSKPPTQGKPADRYPVPAKQQGKPADRFPSPSKKVDNEALRFQRIAVDKAQRELDKQKKKLEGMQPKVTPRNRVTPEPKKKPKKPKFGPGDSGGNKPLPGYFEV